MTNATREPVHEDVDGEDCTGCLDGSEICGPDCVNMLFYFNCSHCEKSYKTYMCTF
jgi:hypothetical protein